MFFFQSFSQPHHPLIKFYNGELTLSEKQVDSLVDHTIEERDSEYLLALALYQRGVLLRKWGRDIDAFTTYGTAVAHLKRSDTLDYYLQSALFRNQGAILHHYKLYEEAVRRYEAALEPSFAYSKNRGISTRYNIGLSMAQYDPSSALPIFLELLDQAYEDKNRLARIYNQLGILQDFSGNYQKAIEYYRKGLGLAISERLKADLLQNISDTFYNLEDYLNQERFLLQVLQIPQANRFLALMDLGQCYILREKREEALKTLVEAFSLYDQQPLRPESIKVFEWLKMVADDPLVYSERQVAEQAKYIERMDVLKESMKTLAMKNKLAELEADAKRVHDTDLYQLIALLAIIAAICIAVIWKIWWVQLRKNLGKKIIKLVEGWDDKEPTT